MSHEIAIIEQYPGSMPIVTAGGHCGDCGHCVCSCYNATNSPFLSKCVKCDRVVPMAAVIIS